MIIIRINDQGDTVTVDAAAKDVTTESGTLVVRRAGVVVARYRRWVGWHSEDPTPAGK